VPAKSSGSSSTSSSQAPSSSGSSTASPGGAPLPGSSASSSAGAGSTGIDPSTTPAGNSAPGVTATTLPNPLATTPSASSSATQPGAQSAAQAPAAADPPLVLTYRAAAWTEVRDSSGKVIVSRTMPANSVERVNVLPPFELTIANANMVTVSYRGVPVDISPYVKQNTARLMLK